MDWVRLGWGHNDLVGMMLVLVAIIVGVVAKGGCRWEGQRSASGGWKVDRTQGILLNRGSMGRDTVVVVELASAGGGFIIIIIIISVGNCNTRSGGKLLSFVPRFLPPFLVLSQALAASLPIFIKHIKVLKSTALH